MDTTATSGIPWFGARKLARHLSIEVEHLREERDEMRRRLETLGVLSVTELEERKNALKRDLDDVRAQIDREQRDSQAALDEIAKQAATSRQQLVQTDEIALLQEAGVYRYRHPLSDAVAYQKELVEIEDEIKEMNRREGGAVLATQKWTVNGSESDGRKMVRDFSKLMLRAFNAEADNLVRGLKPYRLDAAVDRLRKVAATIEKLGKTMSIRISTPYEQLRVRELEVTADFLEKQAEEKEAERVERARLKEERRVQQEMERERARLEKEQKHFQTALLVLIAKGDETGAERLRSQLADVQRAIEDVDYRAANVRAGYVYVISNIGSFGERMVKIGMTRRLDPMDRIRELSDASVPFNFDIHALFFSKDAVGIEAAMHEKLAQVRVNAVNRRREFFHTTPMETKAHLAELTGEMLEFIEVPEALEYRQCLAQNQVPPQTSVSSHNAAAL